MSSDVIMFFHGTLQCTTYIALFQLFCVWAIPVTVPKPDWSALDHIDIVEDLSKPHRGSSLESDIDVSLTSKKSSNRPEVGNDQHGSHDYRQKSVDDVGNTHEVYGVHNKESLMTDTAQKPSAARRNGLEAQRELSSAEGGDGDRWRVPVVGDRGPVAGWVPGETPVALIQEEKRDMINTDFQEWSNWDACSESCGFGVKKRIRKCRLLKGHCEGHDTELMPCRLQPCQ